MAGPAIAAPIEPLLAYQNVRGLMRPGDVIGFGGRGALSETIKLVTRCPVSHVGVILRSTPGPAGDVVEVIESTSLDGRCGVTASRFSSRLLSYQGEVWWLSLSHLVRERMNEGRFVEFLLAAEGKRYDAHQAVMAGLHRLGLPGTAEDGGRLFCSELVAAALEHAGAIQALDSSEVTPAGLVQWAIYAQVQQLKGVPMSIPSFNSFGVSARGFRKPPEATS